jgi:hypothetical protein
MLKDNQDRMLRPAGFDLHPMVGKPGAANIRPLALEYGVERAIELMRNTGTPEEEIRRQVSTLEPE